MTIDRPLPTPEQAREQLTASRATSLRSERDRRIHAVGTAAFGFAVAFSMLASNMVSGTGNVIRSVLFFVVWLAIFVGVERLTRTVPRRARVWSSVGIGATFVLTLVAAFPWLNLRAQTEPNTWPMVLVAALAVSVPAFVAAVAIARSRT